MAYETTDQLMAEMSHYWYKGHDGNLYKLLDIFNSHMEKISDTSDRILKWRAIQEAQGTTLDLFGKDIKTYRPTKDDPPYRFLIYLKTLLARAQGTVPSIVKITGSALGTFNGIKIWNQKTPRHVGIALPFDYVSDWPVEKFILDNLQNMLALGYFLDLIVFYSPTNVHGYLATGTTDRESSKNISNSIWWTGWKGSSFNHWYFGTALSTKQDREFISNASWWTGWNGSSNDHKYLATAVTSARAYITNADWWSSWSDKQETSLSVGSAMTDSENINQRAEE